MNCFQVVISRMGLTQLSQGSHAELYSLLAIAPYEGEDVFDNPVDESLRRLASLGVAGESLRKATALPNELAVKIARGG